MPSPEPIDAVHDRDRDVLNLMLVDSPCPWSLDEIARELRSQIAARDAVVRLADAGLLHRRS